MIESISGIMGRIQGIQERIDQISSLGKFSPVNPVPKYTPKSSQNEEKQPGQSFSQVLGEVMAQDSENSTAPLGGIDLGRFDQVVGSTQDSQAMLQNMYKTLQQGQNQDIGSIIKEASSKYGVDENLIKAVIKQESQFTQKAVSSKGAQGYMQLMPRTAELLGVTDSFDPRQNIMGGTKYLSIMMEKYKGDVVKSVAAYNAGPNAVDRAGGIPNYDETKDYVNQVLKNYYEYNRLDESGIPGG